MYCKTGITLSLFSHKKTTVKIKRSFLFLPVLLVQSAFCSPALHANAKPQAPRQAVIAFHASVDSDKTGTNLLKELPRLQKRGINTLFVEIGYNYQWKSVPLLADEHGLSEAVARELAAECRRLSIDLIPEINCLGHQSWGGETFALLKAYPEFDETPTRYPHNAGIYCRSLCPSNENVYPILFALIDEITAVFSVKKIHVGLDEVFLIGEDARIRRNELLAWSDANCSHKAMRDVRIRRYEHLVTPDTSCSYKAERGARIRTSPNRRIIISLKTGF